MITSSWVWRGFIHEFVEDKGNCLSALVSFAERFWPFDTAAMRRSSEWLAVIENCDTSMNMQSTVSLILPVATQLEI